METYGTTEIIRLLKDKQISLFSLSDFARLFNIDNDNTLYKKIQRLEKKKLIKKLIKGKYYFLLHATNDFATANFLYQPSYISLESALSFYGIITGFPYKITSITTKKPCLFNIGGKDFQYSKISADLFWGYEKRDDFLMAKKEKAFLDYLYFCLKGLRRLDWEEFDLKEIDKQKLTEYGRRFQDRRLLTIIKQKKYD